MLTHNCLIQVSYSVKTVSMVPATETPSYSEEMLG